MALDEQARIVLLVEDDPLVSSYVVEVLETFGFAVAGPASSGAEALALAASDRPKLALVDIRLSGSMDGVEVAQRLREVLDVRVIFLTGLSDQATRKRSAVAQPAGFLQKPFKPSQVLTAIEDALAGEPEKPARADDDPTRRPHRLAAESQLCAQTMIDRHGPDAAVRSIEAINAAIDAGNPVERDHWAQVFAAIRQMTAAADRAWLPNRRAARGHPASR